MKLKPWLVFLGPLLVLDACLIFVVASRRYRSDPVPVPVASPLPATSVLGVSSFSLVRNNFRSAGPRTLFCVDGVAWFFDVRSQTWFKPSPVVGCHLGDVRGELERDGVVTRSKAH